MIPFTTYRQAADRLLERVGGSLPATAVVLGSGLGGLAGAMTEDTAVPYGELPGFPRPTVASHQVVLHSGRLHGSPVVLLAGRSHYYEGYSFEQVCFAVRVLFLCGVQTLILTNAGGVDPAFEPGDLMIITDHIKLVADSPCRGDIPPAFGPRFADMSRVYTPALQQLAARVLAQQGLPVRRGVYFYMPGPQFETPAEIRMIRALGGAAVGMSTVPEAIAAAACGMRVLGLSCITNPAAGIVPDRPVTDEEVVEAAGRAGERFQKVICGILAAL